MPLPGSSARSPAASAASPSTCSKPKGCDVSAVPVSGELRGTTVVIEADGRTTVINEPGPTLSDAEWREIVAAVAGSPRHR